MNTNKTIEYTEDIEDSEDSNNEEEEQQQQQQKQQQEQEDHDQDVPSDIEANNPSLKTPASKVTTVNVADLPTPPLSPELLSQRKIHLLKNPAVKRKLDFTTSEVLSGEKAIDTNPVKQQAVVNTCSSPTLLLSPVPTSARRSIVQTTTKLCVTLQAMCKPKYYRYIPTVLEYIMEKYARRDVDEHLIPFLQSIHYNTYSDPNEAKCDHWEPAFLTSLVMPCDHISHLISHLDALVNFEDYFGTYVNNRFKTLKI